MRMVVVVVVVLRFKKNAALCTTRKYSTRKQIFCDEEYFLLYYTKYTAIIKTCAYNNRFALKCAFGESYNELYPGTIYSPPSYDVRFSSTASSS